MTLLTLIGAGAVTLLIRAAMLWWSDRLPVGDAVRRSLRLAGPAALPAVAATGLSSTAASGAMAPSPTVLVGVVAVLAARRTGSVLAGIALALVLAAAVELLG